MFRKQTHQSASATSRFAAHHGTELFAEKSGFDGCRQTGRSSSNSS
jgi:hypothetical protein